MDPMTVALLLQGQSLQQRQLPVDLHQGDVSSQQTTLILWSFSTVTVTFKRVKVKHGGQSPTQR